LLQAADHACDLFHVVEEHHLEGIARRKTDACAPRARWLKIENLRYSQAEGRSELFGWDRRRQAAD